MAKSDGLHRDHWQEWLDCLSPAARREHLQRAQPPVVRPEAAWHVVVAPDGSRPEIRSFPTVEALRAYLMSLGEDDYVFPFFGMRVRISRPAGRHNLRFLILPDNRTVPLFDVAHQILPDDSGSLAAPDSLLVDPEGFEEMVEVSEFREVDPEAQAAGGEEPAEPEGEDDLPVLGDL